jgi:hypothetical protein
LDFGDWEITEITRREFVRNARQRFESHLEEYCQEKDKEAQAAGLVRVLERRNIDTFFWLAGYQVLRWPIENIAEAENRKRPTVGKQIYSLASEIGLQRRPENEYDRTQAAGVIRDALRAARIAQAGSQVLESLPAPVQNIFPPAFYLLISRLPGED